MAKHYLKIKHYEIVAPELFKQKKVLYYMIYLFTLIIKD